MTTLTASLPASPARPTPLVPTGRASRAFRIALALLFAVAGGLLMANEHTFRELETELATRLFPMVFADDSHAGFTGDTPVIAFGVGVTWWALRVTIECSIALYLGPLLALAGAFVAAPRMNLFRVAIAASVSMAAMVLLNQVRFLMLGYSLSAGGRDVFEWMHSLVGSTLMILGLAACLFLFFRIVVIGSRRLARRERK